MNSQLQSSSIYRRTWLALLAGMLALLMILVVSMLAEPFLIHLAKGAPLAGPRARAGGWGNTNLWLAATSACCFALFVVGYVTKRLSPFRSQFSVIVLVALVILYVFFAQFPATESKVRIALWSIVLPGAVVLGAWLASRLQNTV